jgi:hypothetical protein
MTEQLDLFEVYDDSGAHEVVGVVVGDIEDFALGEACSINGQEECEVCQ